MPRVVQPSDDMIAEASRRLRAGEVVALPTETVYGLGADTLSEAAIECVYQLKGRPFNNPLIAHVLDWNQAQSILDFGFWNLDSPTPVQPIIQNVRSKIQQLTHAFWPGPLTLVLPKSDRVPPRATAGLSTIALRAPSHPVARRLLQAFGGPISAPSANRSGHVSPTTAQHVRDDFSSEADLLILDGGPCALGIESTVLDLTSFPPRVLRPGSVTVEQLRGIIPDVEAPPIATQAASPGTTALHYAPRTPAELIASSQLHERLQHSTGPMAVLALDVTGIAPPHRAIVMPRSPAEYAQSLYRALREADSLNCVRILIEQPPAHDELWRAIHDRLRRATAV